jgi:hypothetical protein
MSSAETQGTWTAPYAVWKTLQNTIEKMAKDGSIPGRIDRSYLSNLPGSAQSELQTAMKSLGLVDDQFHPTELLERLVQNEADRPAIVREIIEARYAPALALGQSATQAQLEEAFRTQLNVSGSTLRKAVRFFLNAAQYAEIGLSPHFKAPSATTPGERRPRKPRTPSGGGTTPDPPPTPPAQPTMHPFIQGLVGTLPDPGAAFPSDKQEAWFDTARGIFRLIYETDDPEPRVRFAPNPNGGDSD